MQTQGNPQKMDYEEENKNVSKKPLCITGTNVVPMDSEQLTKITITEAIAKKKKTKKKPAAVNLAVEVNMKKLPKDRAERKEND